MPERYDVSNDDTHATTVFPDIIVHRRRSTTNCVIIEIKKQGGTPLLRNLTGAEKSPPT